MTPQETSDAPTPLDHFPAARRGILHLAVAALLALLLAIFFWQLTVQHRVLSPADWVFTVSPWASEAPPGYDGPTNANQGDDAFLYFPRRHSLFDGGTGASWWQDDYLSGARNTFSNDFIGFAYYPPAWFYHLLPFPVANGFFHVSILLLAGVSMYLLLWQLKLPRIAAVYGGMMYMLNGHFIVWLGAAILPGILALVPLMIFGFERYRERREPGWLLIPAVCLALQLYVGYIPGWVTTGVVLSFYGVARLAPSIWKRDHVDVARQAAAYAVPTAIGLFLGAYSLVPSVASALSSDYQGDRVLGLQHISLESAWTYLFPNYWGSSDMPGGVFLARDGDYAGIVDYFGITALPLVFLGFWRTRGTWVFWFTGALLIFSVSQIYGIPPLKELAHLPGLKQTHELRWNFGVTLSVCLLAPFGMAALVEGVEERRTRTSLIAGLAAVLAIATFALLVLAATRSDAATLRLITEQHGAILGPSEVIDAADDAFTHFHRQVGFLVVGFALAIGALFVRRRLAPTVCAGIFVVTFVDLFAFGHDYNATIEREDLYPETPGIEFLQSDDDIFRVAPVGAWLDPFPGYTANLYGLDTIGGYDHYRNEDYQAFLGPMQAPADDLNYAGPAYVTIGSDRWPLNENLLNLLNVKYIATPPQGLFYNIVGQPKNETPLGVYADVTQGQSFNTNGAHVDTFEFLLGTGGSPGPDVPVTIRLTDGSPDSETLYTWTVDGATIIDNRWFRIDLPANVDTTSTDELYIELSAPGLPQSAPLYVWGVSQSDLPDAQRFQSGLAAPGTLTFRALRAPDVWAEPVYEGDDLAVYEISSALPRAWGVGNVEIVPSKEDAIERVAEESFDPAETAAVAESDLPKDLTNAQNEGTFNVVIASYATDAMEVRTSFSSDGYLVVSNQFDGGWQATIDGDDAEIVRANGILQAVPVSAGDHTVKLDFEPAEYVWGKRISMTSVVLLLLAIVGFGVYRLRVRQRARDDA